MTVHLLTRYRNSMRPTNKYYIEIGSVVAEVYRETYYKKKKKKKKKGGVKKKGRKIRVTLRNRRSGT